MPTLDIKPSHKKIKEYYDSLAEFEKLGYTNETSIRAAFQSLLEGISRQFKWKLVPEFQIRRKGKIPLRVDGAFLDSYNLPHGYWEAKDSGDDLEKEIKAKFDLGYPKDNILFQAPDRAILYQNQHKIADVEIRNSEKLVEILVLFFAYQIPAYDDWERAVSLFKDKVPELGTSLKTQIEEERKKNRQFVAAFKDFLELCRTSINPNISEEAVEEMLIQHILTERIFRKIFSVADFTQRNVIAIEIEKVITSLTSRHFSRDQFLERIAPFYMAIENAASTIDDFNQKQTFLNTVYERFFQGFCINIADTHGIVYTPQPIVDFMVRSVEEILKKEFDSSISNKGIHIIDPFVGTGNFIVNLMRQIKKSALPHKYAQELFCNEVMLLPYYIASLNIEHTYYEETNQYLPFEGICLMDTFETAHERIGKEIQEGMEFFTKANTERIKRQRKSPIFVIIANPPYNAGQINENDNNKNRKYPELDKRISQTYAEDSKATLLRKLSDPYVKAIRFASDRIGESGIVAFVNNNSFIEEITFDGMRKHLAQDFDLIYVLNLGGNVRKNPKLSGTTHNVFGIQVGVSINFFIRKARKTFDSAKPAKIFYHAAGEDWRKEQKYQFLDKSEHVYGVKWKNLKPTLHYNWVAAPNEEAFRSFVPLGNKETKKGLGLGEEAIFKTYSLGVATNRDEWLYGFNSKEVSLKVQNLIKNYNSEVVRYIQDGRPKNLDSFVNNDDSFVKWTDRLKEALSRGRYWNTSTLFLSV